MEKKLTDEEIVKALECLVKDGEYHGAVVRLEDFLDLIQRQKAEIERLKNFIDFKMSNVMCDKCKEKVVKETAEKVFNEVMSCIGSLQMFWIVDGKARTLVDAEKLFEESCKIAKKHGICLDEEETKDKAKTVQWSKYEVE